jgi:hypothetical protein
MSDQSDNLSLFASTEFDYSSRSDQGLEESPVPQMPEFQILQPQNPAREDAASPLYGAESGQIFNRTSKALYASIEICPCYVRQIWRVFDGKRGKKRVYLYTASERPANFRFTPEDGLTDSMGRSADPAITVFGLHLMDGRAVSPCMIRFTSTSLNTGREIVALLNKAVAAPGTGKYYRPPAFAHTIILATQRQQKDVVVWYTWTLDPAQYWVNPRDPLYTTAGAAVTQFRRAINAQLTDRDDKSSPETVDDDIPF